jgi:hypothetical protein
VTHVDDCDCGDCLRAAIAALGDRVVRLEGRLDFMVAAAKPTTAAQASAAVSGALADVDELPPLTRRLDGKGRGR